jgi:hypothetical protein
MTARWPADSRGLPVCPLLASSEQRRMSRRCTFFLSPSPLHMIWSPGAGRLVACVPYEPVVVVFYRDYKIVFSDEVPLPASVVKNSIHGVMVVSTSRQ